MTDKLIEQIKADREAGTQGKWRVEYKHGNRRLIYHVKEGQQPIRFHRFIQRVCFGFKWEKDDE